MSKEFNFSICMPVYQGSHLIGNAIDSIRKQEFENYEILIGDDNQAVAKAESQKTKEILDSYNDPRIKYTKNEKNLGYPENLKLIVSRAKKDIIFLMAQDDFLSNDALQKTHDAFLLSDDIGVVTRPYFWFYDDLNQPVRAVTPYDPANDAVLSVHDGKEAFNKIFDSVGQLSGLAYRREYLEVPFHHDVFPAHIYPFAGILKKHKCVFLKDYTVAVGIQESQTRFVSSIYDKSPVESWVRMFNTVFSEPEFSVQRKWGNDDIASHYVGLVQLKNFGNPGVLRREILLMIKYRKKNLLAPLFWFFSIGCLITPRTILVWLVDKYKLKVNCSLLKSIEFNFTS